MADAKLPRTDFYVYVLFRHDTGEPFYVGKGHGRRWLDHEERKSKNEWKEQCLSDAKAAGVSVPKVKVASNLVEADAFAIERLFISAIGRRDKGGILANLTNGGQGIAGCDLTHRKPPKRRAPTTDEARRNMSAAQKNRIVTDAHKDALRNWVRTDEVKAAMSAGRQGMTLADDHKANIGAGSLRFFATTTAEQRSAWARKCWEARRRNYQNGGADNEG